MNINEFKVPKPKDPKEVLTSMERGVFDAVMALSAAMDKGILTAFLVAPSQGGTMVELILPAKEDAPEDAPNPSKKIEAATPAAVISMAGEIMNQMITLDHQNTAAHSDYISAKQEHRRLRAASPVIISPNLSPKRN